MMYTLVNALPQEQSALRNIKNSGGVDLRIHSADVRIIPIKPGTATIRHLVTHPANGYWLSCGKRLVEIFEQILTVLKTSRNANQILRYPGAGALFSTDPGVGSARRVRDG